MTTHLIDKLAGEPCETYVQSAGQRIARGDGFSATSYQHTDFRGLMDPLIMVDHFTMTAPTFGTHPHAGLSAVTVVFEDSEGTFRNRDSLGNDIDLEPGDLYWFKAARGAMHNEQPRPGSRTHALQVFVGLPADRRQAAPSAFHLRAQDVPRLQGERATARLLLGESNGLVGATAPDNPLSLLDITLQPGGRFAQHGADGSHAWLLAIDGVPTVTWDNERVEMKAGTAIAFDSSSGISISSDDAAHVVLFRGKPLRQAFVQRGPFVMGNAGELDAVEAAYRDGLLGSLD
ncbi:pirin-like C-terminal cupin domain-containing protein [uncultured Sulfitobacter sp.]|uniref:pirin family protein n=1 Tax=uncultured Sulfitobacter sp. TaxID=191468 RepID=UPI0026091DD3|nr:pirin-like C-terminal cupin domain-containing protein [uncultured Sulfitobacter sp.]